MATLGGTSKVSIMPNEVQPDDSQRHHHDVASFIGKFSDPGDFHEGGQDHRKSVLATSALIVVLSASSSLKPGLFGVSLSPLVMWVLISIGHLYFFVMWRLTAPVESDGDRRFWNLRGLWRQAFCRGTREFPGKTKAQLFFIRALPIWAFIVGVVGIGYGIWQMVR